MEWKVPKDFQVSRLKVKVTEVFLKKILELLDFDFYSVTLIFIQNILTLTAYGGGYSLACGLQF